MTSFVGFNPTFKTQFDLDFAGKIIVDFFAGGGYNLKRVMQFWIEHEEDFTKPEWILEQIKKK